MARILILLNNPRVSSLCQMVLAKAGYEPVLSREPVEGLRALTPPLDITMILLGSDLSSPGTEDILTGLERNPQTCNIPVVLCQTPAVTSENSCEKFPAVIATLNQPFIPAQLMEVLLLAHQGKTRTTILQKRKEFKSRFSESLSAFFGQSFPTAPPAFQGQISQMSFAEITQILCLQRKNGVLLLQNDNQTAWVFFQNGMVQFVQGRNFSSCFQMGKILLQLRYLKPSLLNKILHSRAPQTPLGAFLLKNHYLSEKLLKRALKEQSCLLFYELLRWQAGEFSYFPLAELPALAQEAQLSLSGEALVLEGYKRVDEWKVLEKEVGSLYTILERTPQPTAVLENLTGQEKEFLERINGTNSILEISEVLAWSPFAVYKVCHQLVSRKIVKARPGASSSPLYDA